MQRVDVQTPSPYPLPRGRKQALSDSGLQRTESASGGGPRPDASHRIAMSVHEGTEPDVGADG
jgi:hypothetical protein